MNIIKIPTLAHPAPTKCRERIIYRGLRVARGSRPDLSPSPSSPVEVAALLGGFPPALGTLVFGGAAGFSAVGGWAGTDEDAASVDSGAD